MQTEAERHERVASPDGCPVRTTRAPWHGARTWRRIRRIAGGARLIARGLVDTAHPLLAQIVPIRRCNIDCAYCNEYDKVSPPVAVDVMRRRIDRLAELRTEAVSFTGGEPLLHPSLAQLIAHVRGRGMTAALITNGYLLSTGRISELNDAGLEYLQISLDNVNPDEVSKKSLRLLDRKLEWLASDALFDVHVNTVVGAGTRRAEDALEIARRARALGLSTSVGIIHDQHGQLKPLSAEERQIYAQVRAIGTPGAWLFKNLYAGLVKFEDNLVEGRPNTWRCRAGARYLYVCEDGLVHYCSQQRGTPGIPLEVYTRADIERAYRTPKGCAPFCTIGCVHRVSIMDFWRDPQTVRRQSPLTGRAVRWEWIVVVYAGYFAAVAWSRGYSPALKCGTLAALISVSVFALLPAPIETRLIAVRNWLPLVLLLAGYRLSGLFFVAPMRSVEERLLAFDRRVFDVVGRKPYRWTRAPVFRGALEFAYLLVYAMVPLGVVTLYLAGASNQLPRYWAVVLTACFTSYAMLPWLQTRPPRVVEGLLPASDAWDAPADRAPLRRLNLAILRRSSNQVNTLPSGHVAAALAVALMVLASAPAAGLAFLALTVAIAVSTVVGRYHYTVDTFAGVAVALGSWWWLG